MNTEPLIALIRKYNLSQHQSQILNSVRPAIFFGLEQLGQGEIGQSRIGGVPDLPSSMRWPKSQACDRYLCFILQINFAQLPRFPQSPFPSQGMLYLFASEGEDAAEQVVLFEEADPLQPCPQPDLAEMMTDWYEEVVPHTLSFALAPDIPRWATNDFYVLCNDFDIDEEPLDDIARALSKDISKNYLGKLLGHAAGIGHDPRQNAYVARDVNPAWVYDYEKRKTLDMTHAQRWCNLLTVESNGAADLWFGDAGYLQVLIHDSDLSRMDLSRVYVGLETS
ncbi:MAG: YwqG family protein [Cyanobacteria bacterium P01_F01_bin.53]